MVTDKKGRMISASPDGPTIREIACRTVLNRCSISDYSLNCYVGCRHGCAYCYARFMQRFHPHPEPWGDFVDVKVNAVEVLGRQLRRLPPGEVFMSSACDGWQPVERERGLTRECCRLLLEHNFKVNALTKSSLILRDLDLFAARRSQVGVTITTLDERLRPLWEPRASSVEERLQVLREARAAGVETAVMFGPLLPMLSDNQRAIESMVRMAADLAVDRIWVDALNPRPKVWPSVAGLLEREFPNLRKAYSQILFSKESREAYLGELRRRVTRAATKHRLTGRLTCCF